MNEEWKKLVYKNKNYGNVYLISNFGRIKNMETGCIRKPCFSDKNPYPQITLYINGKTITIRIHRAVAENFIPNPDNLPQVNHKDGNKTNNHVDNLEWVTAKENCIHAVINNLFVSGETSNLSKLTKDQIEYIKNNCIPGHKDFGCAALAKKYNVDHSTISKIIHDCAWKNYSGDYKLIKNKINKLIKECEQNNDCKKTIKDTKKPSYDELLKLIKSTSFVQIGKMYEVSDNAVRKWCMSYNLPYRQKDIKKLIDTEC